MIGPHEQNELREERIPFMLHMVVHHPEKSGKEFKSGTWRQELMHKPRKNAIYLLASHDLLSLLSSKTTAQRELGSPA